MERYILNMYKGDYTIFFCNKDGLFGMKNGKGNLCPSCQSPCEKVDNVDELLNR